MNPISIKNGRLDRMAMGLSGLCAVHCLASAILLGIVASASNFLGNPLFHEVGISCAIVLGAVALGVGAKQHGFMMPAAVGSLGLGVMAGAMTLGHGYQESLYTILGVGILALGHDLNYRAGH